MVIGLKNWCLLPRGFAVFGADQEARDDLDLLRVQSSLRGVDGGRQGL